MTGKDDRPSVDGLTFQQGDLSDPARWEALAALLEDIFGIDITVLDQLGGPDPSSMAFGWFNRDNRLVANLSAFALPMMINGRPVHAAGLQSGAVLPEFRGRGLFRDVTKKALAWCDTQGFEAVFLYTDKPALYTQHSFTTLPQSRFSIDASGTSSGASTLRLLNLGNTNDLAFVQTMLAVRAPVSTRFAAVDQNRMFLLNSWFSDDIQLGYSPVLEAMIAWRQTADTLEILDIVARKIPDLEAIIGEIGLPAHRIDVDFVPDRLSAKLEISPDDNELELMMRGPETLRPDGPIRLPELAQF